MITDAIIWLFKTLIDGLLYIVLQILPTNLLNSFIPIDWSFLNYVYLFINETVFLTMVNVFLIGVSVQLIWSIVYWSYKKIPGVT